MSHAGTASGSPLAATRVFTIPRRLLEHTVEVLRTRGEEGLEAFVVWGGVVRQGGTEIVFRSGLVPAQEGHATPDGLLVTVSGKSLFDVNRQLYERGELLAAQVHSHPTDAYHSDTDDCHSLVTLTGALSIVVPSFGRGGAHNLTGWAWYRLVGEGAWDDLTRSDQVRVVAEEGTP